MNCTKCDVRLSSEDLVEHWCRNCGQEMTDNDDYYDEEDVDLQDDQEDSSSMWDEGDERYSDDDPEDEDLIEEDNSEENLDYLNKDLLTL